MRLRKIFKLSGIKLNNESYKHIIMYDMYKKYGVKVDCVPQFAYKYNEICNELCGFDDENDVLKYINLENFCKILKLKESKYSSKLFRLINKSNEIHNDKIIFIDFVNILLTIYKGTNMDDVIKLFYNIINFNDNDTIYKDNLMKFLQYLKNNGKHNINDANKNIDFDVNTFIKHVFTDEHNGVNYKDFCDNITNNKQINFVSFLLKFLVETMLDFDVDTSMFYNTKA